MTEIYRAPDLDLEDEQAIAEIQAFRTSLADYLRVPKRWVTGRVRPPGTARRGSWRVPHSKLVRVAARSHAELTRSRQ